jgi:HSP20 family protein
MARSIPNWSCWSPSLIDDVGRELNRFLHQFRDPEARQSEGFSPTINVAETEKGYEIVVDLPGMNATDFNLEFKDGQLWISGERKHDPQDKGKTYLRMERMYGQFRRVVALGADIDVEKAEADYKDGVLTVRVPKAASVLPKRIPVRS